MGDLMPSNEGSRIIRSTQGGRGHSEECDSKMEQQMTKFLQVLSFQRSKISRKHV
jgi:hypothetical protein